jgi:hypothetical protein
MLGLPRRGEIRRTKNETSHRLWHKNGQIDHMRRKPYEFNTTYQLDKKMEEEVLTASRLDIMQRLS